jgi:quercetin dioxygenase-like cupin family protein
MANQNRWFMNGYLRILLSKSDNPTGVSLIEHTMPGGSAVPLHVHNSEDETFYVLEGELRLKVGHDVFECSQGQAFHVPAGAHHSYRVLSPVAKFLTLSNGAFEDMIWEASVPADQPGLPRMTEFSEADLQRLGAICNRNGIEFIGPPID